MDNRKNNGGHSTKPRSKNDKRLASKTDREIVYDLLNPFTEEAVLQHSIAIREGERWAIELFYKYQFGMPTQTIDSTHTIKDFNIKEVLNFDKSKS